jgi:hypothetical protein
MKQTTKVKFLIEKPEGNLPCNVFAFFPEEKYNSIEPDIFTCYAHTGQHSACHIDYANECKEAPINEYFDLLNELINYGDGKQYNDLQIMNEQTIECHRPPTKGEIKFGEGATHYRDFPLSIIGLKKGKAMRKDWFVAPDDKLRYYTR